jgi:tetratricopeptide (TPR) repeat protein
MGDVPGMSETVQLIKPTIEKFGNANQRSVFHGRLVTLAFRRDRYVISDETLQNARLAKQYAAEAASQTGELTNLMLSPFILGFTYFWHGNFHEAEENFIEALALAERTGNQEQRVLVLSYRGLLYRLAGDLQGAQEFVPRALQAAQEARMPMYIGLAMANQAWISLQQGDPGKAEAEAKAADAQLRGMFPHYGVVVWPLIAIYLGRGEVGEAIELARKLVLPSQRKLVDALDNALQTAIQLYDAGDEAKAGNQLRDALRLAEENREGITTAE